MKEDLRVRLREEMAGHDGTPISTLVTAAVHGGRREKRLRRVASGAGTLGVVTVTVLALVVGSQLSGGSPTAAPSLQAGAPAAAHTVVTSAAKPKPTAKASASPTTKPAPAPVAAVPPAGVPATAGGVLELLSQQLGSLGTVSHTAVASDDPLHAQIYLETAAGTGMVRVDLQQADFTPALCLGPVKVTPTNITCTQDKAGDYVVTYDNAYEDNCTETQSVQVIHPDGSQVTFYLATCLAWDGAQNASSPQIITAAQAAALGADPRWDLSMPASLVAAGATHFPSPATFS